MPVRKPGISSRSATGFFSSVKTGKTHYFESGLERDHMYLFEFDPLVKTFGEQPFTIRYKNQTGKSKRYTPDFLVQFTTLGHIKYGVEYGVYEMKYERELKKNHDVLTPKFEAASEYVKIKDWKFYVCTEEHVDKCILSNAKLLDQFLLAEKYEPLSRGNLEKLKELGTFTPKEFLNSISSDRIIQAQLIPSIWHLAAIGQLSFDMKEKITMNTKFLFNDKYR